MSTQGVTSTGTLGTGASNAPLSVAGLGSGINTTEVVNALIAAERKPVTELSNQETTLQAQQTQLRSIQSSLQQLAFSAADLSSPELFNTTQAVTSSNPSAITALTTQGAGVGGYQVNVTQLANSAQRTFTFTSPAGADTLTIDGNEFTLKAGETAQELVSKINSDNKATVYAAALEGNTIVLSSRSTGKTSGEFIQVSDPGATLVEKAGTAKEGQDAEYTVDEVAGTSSSNTVTNAIAGVTLTLSALTSTSGPATIEVGAPAPSTSAITAQVESFVKLYNSTIGSINKQLTTKPPANPSSETELQTGTLFGDIELTELLNNMRQAVYNPIEGLSAEMSSLSSIGVSTGAASGSATPSQTAVEGDLTVNTAELAKAIETNPAGVEQMLQHWGQSFQKLIDNNAEPGGTIETRLTGEGERLTEMSGQITTMNELLAVRQKSLQSEYLAMERAVQESQSLGSWLNGQITALEANSVASATL
jgi:flagellar hook-associated protein 2